MNGLVQLLCVAKGKQLSVNRQEVVAIDNEINNRQRKRWRARLPLSVDSQLFANKQPHDTLIQ